MRIENFANVPQGIFNLINYKKGQFCNVQIKKKNEGDESFNYIINVNQNYFLLHK